MKSPLPPAPRAPAQALRRALRLERFESVLELLRLHPDAPRESVHLAAQLGSVEALRTLLDADPALLEAREAGTARTPLLCVAASKVHGLDDERARGLLACADLLIERGADLEAWQPRPPRIEGLGEGRRTILATACGIGSHLELVHRLIEAGCSVSDPEAVCLAASHPGPELLELLLARGADAGANGAVHAALASQSPRNLTQLLIHDAPLDQRDSHARTPLHLAVQLRCSALALDLLLHSGAPINARDEHGRTAYRLAVRQNSRELAAGLLDAGCDATTHPADQIFSLCAAGDAAGAVALLADSPELFDAISEGSQAELFEAVLRRDDASQAALLEVGFAPDALIDGDSALHAAAEMGDARAVAALLAAGADVQLDDASGASALARAVRAAWNEPREPGEYPATVAQLLRSGAVVEDWMAEFSEDEVRAALLRRAA